MSSRDPANAGQPTSAPSGVAVISVPRHALEVMAGKFPEGVTVLVCPPESMKPEFVRYPKEGECCPVTGLPRTTLAKVLKKAGKTRVKLIYLRNPGSSKGITLIHRQSLIDYINSLPAPAWMGDGEELNEDGEERKEPV